VIREYDDKRPRNTIEAILHTLMPMNPRRERKKFYWNLFNLTLI